MHQFHYFVKGRLFEWIMTLATITMGIQLLLSPDGLLESAFNALADLMPPKVLGAFLFILGWTRLIGLLMNGYMVSGRYVGRMIRSFTAGFSAMLWAQFSYALFSLTTLISGEPGFYPGIHFWSFCVLGELYVSYRAVAGDGRTH
jgi:hypothetical protein